MSATTPVSTEVAHADADRTRKPRRARLVRRALWMAAALLIAAAVALSLRPKPIGVELVAPRRGNLSVTVEEMGKTRVRDRYIVSAPTSGNLLRLELRPGDAVRAGDTLASIVPMAPSLLDPRSRAEAQSRALGAAAAERQSLAVVARSEVAKEHADQDLERTRALVTGGSLPPERLRDAELAARLGHEELASARFAAQMTAHEVAMTAAALKRFDTSKPQERFDVTSPAAGRILRVLHESAGVVQPGMSLLELGDPSHLEIVSDILTADAVRIPKGARVDVLRWGGDPLAAHVRVVEPAAFTRLSALGVEEQRVSVIIDLDEETSKLSALGDGYRVEVRIVVEDRKNVLAVPLGATFRHASGWATYAVRDGVAHLTPVQIGARSDSEVEIKSGLVDGDRVVLHPSERVGEGVRVVSR